MGTGNEIHAFSNIVHSPVLVDGQKRGKNIPQNVGITKGTSQCYLQEVFQGVDG